MKISLLILLLISISCFHPDGGDEVKRYEEQAARVTIIRDKWGIPHVYGQTDADAVFGLMYAQCEENFEKVEKNYLEKLGRMSELEGSSYLYSDLLMRLIYDTSAAIADYQRSPAWLKKLLKAFADGVNYYLYKNPAVKPALLKKFEPWWPLLFTDGGYTAMQTGGLTMQDIKAMYPIGNADGPTSFNDPILPKHELTGSNAFAIAPAKSESGNALLYINPHVSFYFRTEMHMVSSEGLNAYGAVTWGQFFVCQGFNDHCGWMHTSSTADAADLYAEKIVRRHDSIYYAYDGRLKKVLQKQQTLKYKKGDQIIPVKITSHHTHHGPVVGSRANKWLSLKENNRSLNGLIQSWQRSKAAGLEDFKKTMLLQANNSTNTMYSDDKGNIAYWHSNFIPRRNTAVDWSLPVDGSTVTTEWQGLHSIDELVHLQNPGQGWMQNCNSTPFSISGLNTINAANYPAYMAPEGENFRSALAIKELEKESNYSIDKLISLGYNPRLAIFDSILPPLFAAYDSMLLSPQDQELLQEPIAQLRSWDRRSSISSVATTLAVEWGYYLINQDHRALGIGQSDHQVKFYTSLAGKIASAKKLDMLLAVIKGLEKTYGTWKVPWGDVNRYQRPGQGQQFDDAKKSWPVGMASAFWGSLPAYETVWNETQKGYGVAGNSFVAVVEFGKKIRAKSIVAGGQSFDPGSAHFSDQVEMYLDGKFKDVFFYKEEVERNAERRYHPGEK